MVTPELYRNGVASAQEEQSQLAKLYFYALPYTGYGNVYLQTIYAKQAQKLTATSSSHRDFFSFFFLCFLETEPR